MYFFSLFGEIKTGDLNLKKSKLLFILLTFIYSLIFIR